MTDQTPSLDQLVRRLDQAQISDRHRLRRQLHELRKQPDDARLAQWVERFQTSCAKVEARRASVPAIRYDDSLPIAAKRDEIKAAIAAHQVVVIAGETGSGKTTQLPKICLELGRGIHGLIGHTQPRRLAARSVATRVAEEIGTPLGALVGYQVRFEDQSDDSTLVKLMTDGILLAETQHDRYLERYDTLIVDEAHERSLNIDFLLGYLKTLLHRRPDLKLIITSATIDLERFSRHFDGAPVIEVSGRTYPVETWYRPLAAETDEEGNRVEDDLSVDQGILAALDEIAAHEREVGKRPGDVLVFLPGEREIRDAAEMLRKANLRHTEVLPLYARLTPAEQQKIFQPRPGRKMQMLHLRLGDIEAFPFIEPPDGKAIKDGFTLLQELSAVNREGQLTPLGRQLARLPIDPRLGRMLLEAAQQGSLEEVLTVASALSVQDPRERPVERQQAADQAHAQWKDPDSDFAALINLWRGFEEQRQALGSNALRSWCRKNFLNYLRLREWRDAHRQLTLICRELKLPFGRPAKAEARKPEAKKGASADNEREVPGIDYAAVHKAILSGLLSQIGQKAEEGDYLGARQRRFWIHPSSGIARKRPQWIMAAELVETTKLFARMVAKIEPDWLEPLAGHLIKTNHFEPHWEKRRGQVVAFEQVTLYGLIVIGRRPVHYGPIDPPVARELFIREGLVRGEINSRAKCLSANRQLLEKLDELEAKARRRDILADEETLFAYYDARLPADIYQTASFEKWYARERQNQPDLLLMREEDVLAREASEVTAAQYPDRLRLGDLHLSLSYQFEPGTARDGVTVRVPAPLLPQLPAERIDWLVPGLLYDKAVALVRNLPKAIRKSFVPVPDFVRAALERITFGEGSLPQVLGRELQRMTGVRVADEAWAEAATQLDDHLRMNIEVVDAQGKFLGEGRDLAELTARFAEASQAALAIPQADKEQQRPVEAKAFASVAEKAQQKVAGLSMTVYPALVEEQGEVKEGRFPTQAEADYQHRRALQRLLLRPGPARPGVERRAGRTLGAIPGAPRQARPGRQARRRVAGVSLDAGGVPGLAVRPATGNPAAGLGQAPGQAVEPGRGLVPGIPREMKKARRSKPARLFRSGPISRAGSVRDGW